MTPLAKELIFPATLVTPCLTLSRTSSRSYACSECELGVASVTKTPITIVVVSFHVPWPLPKNSAEEILEEPWNLFKFALVS